MVIRSLFYHEKAPLWALFLEDYALLLRVAFLFLGAARFFVAFLLFAAIIFGPDIGTNY